MIYKQWDLVNNSQFTSVTQHVNSRVLSPTKSMEIHQMSYTTLTWLPCYSTWITFVRLEVVLIPPSFTLANSCKLLSCGAPKFSKAGLRFSKQKVKIHEVFGHQNFFQGKSIGYKVTSLYQFLLSKEQWALENYTGRKNFILTSSVKSGSSIRNQVLCILVAPLDSRHTYVGFNLTVSFFYLKTLVFGYLAAS